MWIYIVHCHKVSNALATLVPAEKPSFQTPSEGLIVLLCMEVIRQGVPDHGAVHSECSWCSDNRMSTQQWTSDVVAPPSIVVWLTWDAAYRQHLWPVCNNLRGTVQPCHADICAWWSRVYTLLDLPHRASEGHHARLESGHGQTFLC